jgi:PAS domain S-box-containing protein
MAGSADQGTIPAAALRARAEKQARDEPSVLASLTPEQIESTFHELHVHQIQLEMQNENLRATQAELEKARERYVDLYDSAPVGYLTISEQGLILSANLTSVHLLGVERSRLLKMPFTRFVEKEDQDSFYFCLRKGFDSERTQSCDIKLRPNGGHRFHSRLELVKAVEAGKPVCHVTLSDITEQKHGEEVRREHEKRELQYENAERLRLAFDAGGLGAWDQDLRTGEITCSRRGCAILGFAPGETVIWPALVERVHPDDRAEFLRAAEESVRPGGPGRFEVVFRIRLPGGGVRWLRFAARSFFGPRPPGKVIRRSGVLADITQQKDAEEILRSRATQLEVLVRERTARLQDAVGELEHFSYTLAHDLRAPLRTMSGFGELLLAQCQNLNPVHRQYLLRSNAAAQRMDQLIQDALNYNKIVRENFALSPVDCGALLQELIDSYPQFQEARSSITLNRRLPRVMGNAALLTQCFSNLLNNALKFVPPGTISKVRIFANERDGRVRLWFQDNGIGIAEDCHDKIFEMFQRLSPQYEGTGIGLALVKKAAQRMHGAVGVESQPDRGSRFWLELDKAAE